MLTVLKEFHINDYVVLTLNEDPFNKEFTKVKIENKTFSVVPMYDAKNSVAIKSNDNFVGKSIELI